MFYMKHAVISEKPLTKPRSLAGKAVLKSLLKSVQIVEKQSKGSSKNKETKLVKKSTAKKTVPVVVPSITKDAPVKSPKKAEIKIVETLKLKVKSAKTAKIAAAQISPKKNQTTVSKRNLKVASAQIKIVAGAKAAKSKNQKPRAATIKKTKIVAAVKPRTVLKSPAKILAKAPAKKTQPVIAAKKIAVKNARPKTFAPIAKVKPAGEKVPSVAAAKKSNVKITGKIKRPRSFETSKKVEVEKIEIKKVEVRIAEVIENNLKPEKLPTAQMLKKMAAELIISAKVNKIQAQIRSRKIAPVIQIRKPEVVENKIEIAAIPLPVKPKNKKAKLIGAAIFRGKKERYDFKMFALNETFEAIPAVYIISKRTTDTRKKGHHALICIGETHSIFDELKKHRKGKCVKKHRANVVSILPEADEKIRLKIETDLKAAHSIACLLD